MIDLNAMVETINRLLEQDANKTISCADDLRERHAIRYKIHELHGQINSELSSISRRVGQLSPIPAMEHVEWANAVLAMPNVVFLVLDTTGVVDDSDIIRILVVDLAGRLLFDRIVLPQRQQNANTHFTGISQESLSRGFLLAGVWEELKEVLKGRFVLSFNLEFVEGRLKENAKHYGLSPIYIIGECLQMRVARYYNYHGSQKLVSICDRLGHFLPDRPLAMDRVQGQIAILQAMSQGITEVSGRPDPALDDDSLDIHPF